MQLDPQRVRFKGKAILVAMRCGASLSSPEAGPFFENLYLAWQAANLPLEAAERWLGDRMPAEFKSLGEPPSWVEEEPAWAFLSDRPMVFLTQCSMDVNNRSASDLSPGETVYLFGLRQVDGELSRMVYRTISQFVD